MQTDHADDSTLRSYIVLAIMGVLVLAGGLAVWLTPERERTPEEIAALPAIAPTDIHRGLDYSLDAVATEGAVPAVIVDELEYDLSRIRDAKAKKRTFFKIMLPIIARENERILQERQEILDDPDGVDDELFEKYGAEVGDIEALLKRVDVVPASLVLAQAAIESGWGSSRFALQGNNFFGMRTYNDDVGGMDPAGASGFWVIKYSSIADSVHSYMLNLNSGRAYGKLRSARAQMRAKGQTPSGKPLTNYLTKYSEIPEKYGRLLRGIISSNNLARFDGVRLAS